MNLYEIKALTAHNKINDLVSKTAVTLNHVFADNAARDAYFVTNPTELVDNLFIKVGTGYQQYINSAWENTEAVIVEQLPAKQQSIEDTDNLYTATNVEDALKEVKTDLESHKAQINDLDAEVIAHKAEAATKSEVETERQRINNLYVVKAEQVDLNQTNNNVNATNLRIDNLVIQISPENVNIEVTDAHNSIINNKNFASLKDRFEESEQDLAEHKLDYMPHRIQDLKNNKIYKYSLQMSEDGQPQIKFEEVI